MATEHQRNLVAQAYQSLKVLMPAFVQREEQKQMISRACRHATTDGIGVVEAPTGTGKSLGYLIPGLIAAVTEDRVLVVSTATASLQDQLAKKDIPTALRALELVGINGVKSAVAKGRERHLCPIKLDAITSTKDMFDKTHEALETLDEKWRANQWDGCRDSLPISVTPATWSKVANTSDSCTGESCPLYDECPYYKAMKEAKEARVVIVNHSYLLAHMANVEESFLCDGDKNIYIFDEGHHLADKILSAFAKSVDFLFPWREQIRLIEESCKGSSSALGIASERFLGVFAAASSCTLTLLGDSKIHRFIKGEIPDRYLDLLTDLKFASENLKDVIDVEATAMRKKAASRRSAFSVLSVSRMSSVCSELQNMAKTIDEVCCGDEQARWLDKGRNSIELKSSPFEASEKARKYMWSKIKRGLITSATLSTFGKFDSFLRGLGLDIETPTLKLASPLDYTNARLVVPRFAVDGNLPSHNGLVEAFFMDYAINAVDTNGVLVYFTNKAQMEVIYNTLTTEQKEIVLLQGQWSPSAMIEEHKRRIDSGRRSIICGLDSLCEGVDLPGEYCTRVLVQRIPFPSPSDPVLGAHSDYLKSKGLDPFHLLMLPKAALKLAQAFGRLIRAEGDHGEILVLDQRLVSKAYGNKMIQGTPYTRIEQTCAR